jgi:hypothetical protein
LFDAIPLFVVDVDRRDHAARLRHGTARIGPRHMRIDRSELETAADCPVANPTLTQENGRNVVRMRGLAAVSVAAVLLLS